MIMITIHLDHPDTKNMHIYSVGTWWAELTQHCD